ncbi:hypothetical protein CTheo_5169 [Ceratobasidium theobromae]|uniref:Uncharacterized protein n=1 Tax=Ceratobasidium theobromae TaxID=1582974 RepID=A0A5N5QIR4_9AGAM|nr:hypothetical protein CTheo_5169 [Ceratobasidium theobromae]
MDRLAHMPSGCISHDVHTGFTVVPQGSAPQFHHLEPWKACDESTDHGVRIVDVLQVLHPSGDEPPMVSGFMYMSPTGPENSCFYHAGMSEIALIVKGKVITRVGENESQNEVVANEGDILRYERGVKVWQYTDVETTIFFVTLRKHGWQGQHPEHDELHACKVQGLPSIP